MTERAISQVPGRSFGARPPAIPKLRIDLPPVCCDSFLEVGFEAFGVAASRKRPYAGTRGDASFSGKPCDDDQNVPLISDPHNAPTRYCRPSCFDSVP